MSFDSFNASSVAFVGQIIIRALSHPPKEEMTSAFNYRFFVLRNLLMAEIKTNGVIIAATGQSQNETDANQKFYTLFSRKRIFRKIYTPIDL